MEKSTRKQVLNRESGRSPAYPYISLVQAIVRAEQLWRAVGSVEVEADVARRHWGYGPKSSGGVQVEAALKQFGLLEISGRATERKLRLSPLARNLVQPAPLDQHSRWSLTARAAMSPKIHRALHSEWGPRPPLNAENMLVENLGFNARGAQHLIAEYKDTFAYVEQLGRPLNSLLAADRTVDPNVEAAVASLPTAIRDGEITVSVQGQHLTVSARVDREGLRKLIKLLQANELLLDENTKD
jgi:hypothetical protein